MHSYISIALIKSLCQKYNISPSKHLGQNFVVDQRIVRKMADYADLDKDDVVLEIGPGFGALTQELAKHVKRVITVELDKKIVKALKETLVKQQNVEVVQDDILQLYNFTTLQLYNFQYKLVANLPYNITSAILRKFLENEPKPKLLVLMVQKEVAERVCAKPGKMSLLSVAVQFYANPEIVAKVSKNCFWPKPKVDSAILRIAPRKDAEEEGPSLQGRSLQRKFFSLVRLGFSSRRKQLQNNLASGLKIPKEKIERMLLSLNLNPKIRAQELSLEDWKKLANKL